MFFHFTLFYMDVSENNGFSPQIIHLNRVFHYFHHPFEVPLFLETPTCLILALWLSVCLGSGIPFFAVPKCSLHVGWLGPTYILFDFLW